jgi:uncharacterized protein (TIGR03437 family)
MKKYTLSILMLLAVFALSTRTGESYIRSPLGGGAGTPIAWNLSNPGTTEVANGRIIYNLNPAGSDNVPFAQVEQTIAASFQVWEDVPTSSVAFARGPNTTATTTTNDNVLQIYWLENSQTTSDGLNLTGALAVSRLTTFSSGPRAGEIVDAALVFNGNQFTWAVDARPNAADIAEVATHEIGHIIGISHSPIGGATMFPRSGLGRNKGRTLEPDDRIAASVAYPADGFAASTGIIQGRVRDGNNTGIFGAHVSAVDGNGNVTSGAISQPDGSYSIQGLPPGNYTIYAEPLDPAAGAYFSKADLTSFYSGVNGDFSTSGDVAAPVAAGGTTSRDITVNRGAPAFDAYIVYDAANVAFLNVPTIVAQGQTNVTVGVAGPGLPQSGAPMSISGPGITIIRQYFRTTSNGLQAVLADINVSPSAPPGARNIVITSGAQRTVMTGGIELAPGSGVNPPVAVVSSANFASAVAAESVVAAFGSNLATGTQAAANTPLPTSLAGTSVRLRDGLGNERLAPLFFVSPTQINYQIAPGIQIGNATVTVTSGNGAVSTGSFQVAPVAPGLFTANASGQGLAAALALRIRNGVQTFERITQVSGSQIVPIPIDLGPATDQVFLVLFGTGIRFRSALPACTIGGANMQVTFAGPQGGLVGVDQVNVRLDRSLIGRGSVAVALNVDGRPSNTVNVSIR